MTEAQFYSSAAVAEQLGINVRELNRWVSDGHLSPTPVSGGGHVWTTDDLQSAVDLNGLIGLGIVPKRAAELLADVEASGSAEIADRFELVRLETANVIEVDAADLTGNE